MLEREPQAQEQVNIHEQGGLTSEHWKEIVKHRGLLMIYASGGSYRFDTKDSIREISAGDAKLAIWKIIQVGEAIIDGRIDNAEPYLGNRHWALLCSLDPSKEPRRFNLPSKKLHTPNLLLQQAKQYAKEHEHLPQSVNDTIAQLIYNLTSEQPYKNRIYKWTGEKWVGDFGRYGYQPKYEPYTYPERLSDTEVSEGIEDEFGGGIDDVLHTSPKMLGQKLIELTRTNPEKYGRVELEIPKTY